MRFQYNLLSGITGTICNIINLLIIIIIYFFEKHNGENKKVIIFDLDGTLKKPNPEIYLKAIEKLNVSKESCLIIEDSLEGVKAANNAGIEVLNVVDENMYKTQKIIDTLSTYKMNNLKEFLQYT